jgi:hypothetical protein
MAPKPQGNDLRAVYATSASDVWAVGQAGTVLHYDGIDWSGTSGLLERFAADPQIGGVIENRELFNAVWASGPGDVWIATGGSSPLALQGDGTHWNQVVVPTATSTSILVDVWGTGPSDVWLLDAGANRIWRGSGSNWASLVLPSGVGTPAHIWGLSATEVYVAGNTGLYRFDGANWQQEIDSAISGVWGSTAAGMWATYDYSFVYHRIGTTWLKLTPPSNCGMGLWGSSESSIWFGTCYFDGANWNNLLGQYLSAVTGSSDGGAVGVGPAGLVVNMSATVATPYASLTGRSSTLYRDLAATGSSNLWIAGTCANSDLSSGFVAEAVHWDGTSLTVHDQVPPQNYNAVATSPGGGVWMSATQGATYGPWQLANGTFVASTGAPAVDFTRMWAAADDAVWAITGKDAAIYFYDGSSWKTATHLLSSSSVDLWALRGSGTSDVWVGGTTGMTEHWNGSQWTPYSTPVSDTIVGVWALDGTHAWAVTSISDILTWDGTQWSKLTSLTGALSDIHGCSASDIWAANEGNAGPRLHHYDGSTWRDSGPGVYEVNRPRVWCVSPGDVWLVNGEYGILRRQEP